MINATLSQPKSQEELQIGETSLTSINRVKLLGIHNDRRLNFDYQVRQLCQKASKKLHTLTRICKYID